jgi:hypothetical protein
MSSKRVPLPTLGRQNNVFSGNRRTIPLSSIWPDARNTDRLSPLELLGVNTGIHADVKEQGGVPLDVRKYMGERELIQGKQDLVLDVLLESEERGPSSSVDTPPVSVYGGDDEDNDQEPDLEHIDKATAIQDLQQDYDQGLLHIPIVEDVLEQGVKRKSRTKKSRLVYTNERYIPVYPEEDTDPLLLPETKRRPRIGPGIYQAIEAHGYFGFIDLDADSRDLLLPADPCVDKVLTVHASQRVSDKQHMLTLQPGDLVHVVYLAKSTRGMGMQKGVLEISFVTRSKYFSPGAAVTSMQVGVRGWGVFYQRSQESQW